MVPEVLVVSITIYLVCQKYLHKILYPIGDQNCREKLTVISKECLGSPSKEYKKIFTRSI